MGKKFKKKIPEEITFGKKKEEISTQKSNIPYHLDDKGRKVVEFLILIKYKKRKKNKKKEEKN